MTSPPMNFAGIRFTSVGILLFAYTWHKGMWEEIKAAPQAVPQPDFHQHAHGIHRFLLRSGFCERSHIIYHYGHDAAHQCAACPLAGEQRQAERLQDSQSHCQPCGTAADSGNRQRWRAFDWKGITGIVLLLLSIIFQGYSAISVSEEKDKVNPIFLNAVQMFLVAHLSTS